MTETTPEVAANTGQTWVHQSTGEHVTLLGRRSRDWLAAPTNNPNTIFGIDLTALPAEYTYLSCNHNDNCCASHNHHVSPHRGCILR